MILPFSINEFMYGIKKKKDRWHSLKLKDYSIKDIEYFIDYVSIKTIKKSIRKKQIIQKLGRFSKMSLPF